jgi:hypothetical protein
MKLGIPKSTERKITRAILRFFPILPGPELYDIFVDLREGKKSIDIKIDKAYNSLKETSNLIQDLEKDLVERTEKIKELKEKYEDYAKLAQIEEDQIQPLLNQLDKAVGKGKIYERIVAFLINLVAGIILFVLGVWASPKVQDFFNNEGTVIKQEINKEIPKNNLIKSLNIPQNLRIKSKIEVIDGSIGTNLNYCSHEIKSFEKMDINDCSFKIDSIEYNLRNKYNFNENGELDSYWSYKSEGPLIYTTEDLNNDRNFLKYIGGENLSVKVFEDKIIDSKDSLAIEKILEKHKLIFVTHKNNDAKGRRIIYLYE